METAKEFEPIATQEALDAIIQERLKRQKKAFEEERAALQKEIAEKTALLDELTGANEKAQELQSKLDKIEAENAQRAQIEAIAQEFGVPSNLLFGEDEETLRSNAQKLADYGKPPAAPPVEGTGYFAATDKADNPKLELANQLLGQ